MTPFRKAKQIFKDNWIFYLIGIAALLGLKLFYRSADACDLKWMLAPTARWVGILTGNLFTNIPPVGYVNHSLQFIIAKSCSGVQFMIIVLAALIFSYTHRIPSGKKKVFWTLLCFALSYILTISVNTLRIILSIYLPALLEKWNICRNLLTPEQLHTLIGTAVYFSSLLAIYNFAGWLSLEIAKSKEHSHKTNAANPLRRLAPPAFWYFLMVLGIPLLHHGKNGHEQFAEFALLITVVCMVLLGISYLFALFTKHHHSQSQ